MTTGDPRSSAPGCKLAGDRPWDEVELSTALLLLTMACTGEADGPEPSATGPGAGPHADSDGDADDSEASADCGGEPFDQAERAEDVAYLASVELDGRAPGATGDLAAREMVAGRFDCLGLQSVLPSGGFQEAFTNSRDKETGNVLASLPGADAWVASEVVLVSAHVDHLGDGRLGANDNASGVSGLMAIAASLAAGEPLRRTVLFAAWGSEETGYEGSEAFYVATESVIPPGDVVFNLNMDMIGTYDQTDRVYALGTMRRTPGRTVVDELLAAYPELDVHVGGWSSLSDNVTFCSRGVPYIFLWTEDPACYHAACDTADRVDYPNLIAIARLAADAVAALADSEEDLAGEVKPGRNVCEG